MGTGNAPHWTMRMGRRSPWNGTADAPNDSSFAYMNSPIRRVSTQLIHTLLSSKVMEQQALAMVFATTELFEAVLSWLPLRDLLTVQRVNHRWHDMISNSPTLQQMLFFREIPKTVYKNRPPQLNPLLAALFPAFFSDTIPKQYSEATDIKADPWFQDDFTGAPKLDEEDWFWFVNNSRRAAVLRPEASWRRMLPVQPPTRISTLDLWSFCCTNTTYRSIGEVNDEFSKRGATMGLIYDIVIEGLDNHADSSFLIHWHMFQPLKEEEELRNEICIRFSVSFWFCGGDPITTGLRLIEDDQQVVKWGEKEKT
jgi:hypothetical protein